MKLCIKIFFLLLFPAVLLDAEPYYFKRYQVEGGLSNNNVTCCIQDNHGFMWFGTRDGLNRFDGYTFRVFRSDSDQPKSFESNRISSLALDKSGSLWVGTFLGLYKFNEADETFELLPFTKNLKVENLVFAEDNNLWFIMENKLVKYNVSQNYDYIYDVPDNVSPNSLCVTPLGKIWAALSNGMLYEFNDQSGEFTGYDLFAQSPGNKSKIINIYCTLMGDKIFIGTRSEGVKIFDIQTGTYNDAIKLDKNNMKIVVHNFIQTSPNEVWIATESGLLIYNIADNNYIQVKKRPYDPYSLSANSLSAFCMDKENGIWIATYSGGVNYYSLFQFFEKYYAYPGENAMQGDLVHDICVDRYDNLWIATEDAGLNMLDKKTGRYINFQPNTGERSISHKNIHGLVADEDKLWVGSSNGIDIIDIPGKKVIKHYNGSGSGLWIEHDLVCMKQLGDGRLLVGSSQGVFCYNKTSDRFDFMPQFPVCRIQCITEDHSGVIWTGTVNKGVFYYNPSDESKGRFTSDLFPENSLNTINDIYEDEYYNLWFTTPDGVKKYERSTETTARYTVKNGMPGNITFRIMPDKSKNLWISTTNGLACLNPETDKITVYTQDHGIITNQFNYNSSFKDKSGKMYFGMIRGMISFIPEEIKTYDNKAQAFLTNITVYDKTTFPVYFKDKIVLNSEQSTFSIDFSALSYIAPNITEYAFCMDGLTNNWTYLKKNHTAYYTKLPPGNYTFKVKTANVSGVWNDHPTVLDITVLRPWWFSNLSILIYCLVFIGVAAFVVYNIVRQEKKRIDRSIKQFKYEKEKELYQAKINFFINIAHEIRTPLTLIKSPLEKVINNNKIPQDALGYLNIVDKNANRLLALVNQMLDFRETELQGYSLTFMKTDIVDLLNDIYSRFKDTAEQQNLRFEINTNTRSLNVFIDTEACTKIISNLLSNALKYASSQVLITLNQNDEEEKFTIDVSNDGDRIPNEIKKKIFEPFFRGEYSLHKSGTGLGLPLSRSLAEMHRGTLTLLDTDNHLNIFQLCLPVNQPSSIKISEEKQGPIASTVQQTEYESDPARPTVLIVEDNKEMKEFIGHEINTLYNILTAGNGEEALTILKEYNIQLIISDIMMPVMDGFTLLKKVKTDLEFSHIPIIMLTAKNTTQSRLEGLELGADAYIEKPFSMDILTAQITNLLNNRNSIRNFYFNSPIANMKSMAYTKADENFLEKLNDIINKHIDNINLDVEMLAAQMNMSRPTLYRKIKAISNLTPNELIRISRLKKAAELIMQGNMSIYEISDSLGFNSQSYFSRSFSKQFNMSPTEYAHKNKSNSQLKS